jgi:N utilization substance protein A
VILQKIRDAEREQILADFLERKEHIVYGTIKRMERGNAIIEAGKIEALLPRDQMIPKENLRVGDRVAPSAAYRSQCAWPADHPVAHRAGIHHQAVRLEVPEISDGLMELKACARDPGLRAKIAVKSNDPRVDPIGTCVGLRGSRVTAVRNEIGGENIDIVLWSADPAQFVIGALAPAEVSSIVVDEEKHAMDVVVDEDNLAIAIGRSGQNVRLASELTGWTINLMTQDESAKRSEAESAVTRVLLFMEKLDIDEELADLLIEEGFSRWKKWPMCRWPKCLKSMAWMKKSSMSCVIVRAMCLLTEAIVTEEQLEGVSDDLMGLEGMDKELAAKLAGNGVKTRDDLAELAVDELTEMTGIDDERAKELILKARAHWFE